MASLAPLSPSGHGQPRVEPGFLGVGWSPAVDLPRRLRKGERCARCGRVGGRDAEGIPRGVVCLACCGMHPDDEGMAMRCGARAHVPCREDRSPPARLTPEDRKVIGASVHGRVWLAQLDAERRGRPAAASRYRLWLGLHRDRTIDDDELARRAEGEGL